MPSANFLEFFDILVKQIYKNWRSAKKAFISQLNRYIQEATLSGILNISNRAKLLS